MDSSSGKAQEISSLSFTSQPGQKSDCVDWHVFDKHGVSEIIVAANTSKEPGRIRRRVPGDKFMYIDLMPPPKNLVMSKLFIYHNTRTPSTDRKGNRSLDIQRRDSMRYLEL